MAVKSFVLIFVLVGRYGPTYIKWLLLAMNTREFGGYTFTDAQLDITSDLTDEERAFIGKIMSEGHKNHLQKWQLKQELFDKYAKTDNLFFVELENPGSLKEEHSLVSDFYSGVELDTEEEINDFFNSTYLKKHHHTFLPSSYSPLSEKFALYPSRVDYLAF
jgi:hypothetical protein